VSDRELVTVKSGTVGLVGVEEVGLGEFVGCGLGCTPCGMYRDGAPPPIALEGLYGTETGRTPGLTGAIPEIEMSKIRNTVSLRTYNTLFWEINACVY